MADIIQEQPAVESPVTDAAVAASDAAPLSEHIEQFHQADLEPSEPAPPKRERHRSAKNFARAEDVPRIKELTRELNEWKTKYEEASKPKPEPELKAGTPVYQPPPVTDFDEPEPTLDKWLSDGKDYDRYLRDAAAWDRRREKHEDGKQQAAKYQEIQTQQAQQLVQQRAQKFQTNLATYVNAHPESKAAFESMPNVNVSPLFADTVFAFADEPHLVYDLVRQPALLAELHFLTDGKPASQEHVALTTQWLRTRLQAGTTGAAVRESSPTPPAPRPPTPVRTRPMPPTDGPPSDGGSLMEHQRYFKTAR